MSPEEMKAKLRDFIISKIKDDDSAESTEQIKKDLHDVLVAKTANLVNPPVEDASSTDSNNDDSSIDEFSTNENSDIE